jgi:mRNA interferase MazF
MVPSSAAAVVMVAFPFSDLTQTKLRPAVVIAGAERGDWVLCQVTSNAYADPHAVALTGSDFMSGGLRVTSYARPGKLFTGNQHLIVSEVGTLNGVAFARVVQAVTALVQSALPKPPLNNPTA